MARRLEVAEVIGSLRTALGAVGSAKWLDGEISREELMKRQLDTVFAKREQAEVLCSNIKHEIEARGGEVLLGSQDILRCLTFEDLLLTVLSQMVVERGQ